MSDTDKTLRPSATDYYACDLARTSREFSIIDLASKSITEVTSEAEVRRVIEGKYSGARYALTVGSPRDPSGKDLGPFAVMVVAAQPVPGGPVSVVAYVGGSVHGPQCIPFSPGSWPDAGDPLGLFRMLLEKEKTLRAAHADWRPLSDPHAYRERPSGIEWPRGPQGETCLDCGLDPRNSIHRLSEAVVASVVDR